MDRFVCPFHGWRGCGILGLTLIAGACSHGEPLGSSRPLAERPFNPAQPVRLTLNSVDDRYPSWFPDGSALVYSYGPNGHAERDRCLGELPRGGGHIRRSHCYRQVGQADSTDVFEEASPRTRDEIAWVEHHSFSNRLVPDYGAIMIGSLRPQEAATRLLRLPYVVTSRSFHTTATHLRWLSSEWLAYVGADVLVQAQCSGCVVDTVMVPKDIVLLNRAGGTPVLLPNSEGVSSIWPTADREGLYFTIAGDTRVWQRDLLGGAPVLVHDFASDGIARDVSVVGNRLVALVGGNVSFSDDDVGPRQIDNGGFLRTVDLTSGATATLEVAGFRFRRPVLSPDGRALVAEGFPVGSRNPDLYLFYLE
jgi:hypothetical protein